MRGNHSRYADTIDHLSGSDVNEGSFSSSSIDNIPPKPFQAGANSRSSKLKCCPASMGSVSSFRGKEDVKAKLCSFETAKPLKLDAKLLSISDSYPDIQSNPIMEMQKDMEDFLFKMLEDGFQLDRDLIGEVLGICGYDVKKSFEKLIEFSAIASKERSNLDGESSKKVGQIHRDIFPPSETLWQQKMFRDTNYAGGERSRSSQPKSAELTRQEIEKQNQEKEILATLFCAYKINDDEPPLTTGRRRSFLGNTRRRSRAFGNVVIPPPGDLSPEDKVRGTDSDRENNDHDMEDAYEVLRKAVLEHRRIMREYYGAAVEAYANGDRALAERLLEQGHFHKGKAREADEESNEKIYETRGRNADADDEFLLDLRQQDPQEAVILLKSHLLSLPGIYSCLKVAVKSYSGVDTFKGACRRRILKLLENESIEWTQEGTTGNVSIALDKIQRERLSFYKKKPGSKFPC
ncbi:putative nuclear RNA export factor SDE5 isoform X2 [Rhodamnia argentea]|uniref:Nuclear RNA export factor SDE5 isoform X2 n=1 Tax=Rhodamnia argentea TaxID=178133 RepID=A0ABM3HY73_9MYRT|nr:putative nuclear RNA export factor SDE5 isoform X2 [Rhodamnia argentea]